MKYTRKPIAFNDDDLEGMIQSHDDALVVIAGINGFIVKRMLIDQGRSAEVMVTSFSPYTTILVRLWIHAMGPIPSTLHVKVKFRTEQGIAIVKGNQQVAKQCLVAAIDWGIKQNESTEETPL